MSEVLNDSSEYAVHNLIVNYMAEDGVTCDADAKNYNEQDTYEGGTGSRRAFNNYNKKIIEYHSALKVLLGEQRANIYESIPVIDFVHPENTGFLYTYEEKTDDSGNLDTTTIYAAPEKEDALTLIENEDKFTINRAIMGQPIAEHFYNSISSPTEYNIQTSPWMGSDYLSYYYKGIYSPNISVANQEKEASLQKTAIECKEASTSFFLEYGMDEFSDSGEYSKKEDGRYYDSHDTLLIHPDYANELDVNGVYFVEPTEDKFDGKRYTVEVGPQDIVVTLPRTTYSDDGGFSKILLFKYDASVALVKTTNKTWAEILALEKGTKGDAYYLVDYKEGETGEAAPDSLMYDAEIQVSESFDTSLSSDVINADGTTTYHTNSAARWTLKSDNYQVFVIAASSYTCSENLDTIEVNTEVPDYLKTKFIYNKISQYIDIEKVYTSEASGLLNGLYCFPLERNNQIVEKNSLPSSGDQVTKWQFIDETSLATKYHTTIDIGTKYYKGHLLNRGTIINEPLKLTSHDPTYTLRNGKIYYYKGKASIIYDKLSDAASHLFDTVQTSNFKNFTLRSIDSVITKADYAAITYTTSEAKSLLGIEYKTKTEYSSAMRHPNKFKQKNNKAISTEQLLDYFNDFIGAVEDNTLYLNLNDTDGPCVYHKTTYQPYLQSKTTNISSFNEGTQEDLYNKFKKNFYVNYSVNYKKIDENAYTKIDSTTGTTLSSLQERDGNIYNVSLKILSPLELFSKKVPLQLFLKRNGYSSNVNIGNISVRGLNSWNVDSLSEGILSENITLIYPTYTNYFPETLILLSRYDLGLETFDSQKTGRKGMVSFMSKDEKSAICFRVATIKEWKPSSIRRVHLATPDQTVDLDYPYGIYRKKIVKVEKRITGFKRVVVPAGTQVVEGYSREDILGPLKAYRKGDILNYDKQIYYLTDSASVSDAESVSFLTTNKTEKNLSLLTSDIIGDTSNFTLTSSSAAGSAADSKFTAEGEVETNGSFNKGSYKLTSSAATLNSENLESAAKRIAELKNEKTPDTGAYRTSTLDTFSLKKNSKYDYRKNKGVTFKETGNNLHMGSSSIRGPVRITRASGTAVIKAYGWRAYFKYKNGLANYESWIIPETSTREYITYETDYSYDCFIYVLKPMQLAFNNTDIYDQEDKLINSEDLASSIDMIPMAYPRTFFPVQASSKEDDESRKYSLTDRSCVSQLKNMLIIPGLPTFSSKKDLLSVKFGPQNNLSLTPIANLIYEDSSTSIINRTLKDIALSILKSWKFSDSIYNPILIEDIIPLINGVVEIEPILQKLVKSEFTVGDGEDAVEILPEHINGLFDRINNTSEVTSISYDIHTDSSNWKKIGEDISYYTAIPNSDIVIYSELPDTGEANKYYINEDLSACYIWDGTSFIVKEVAAYDESALGKENIIYTDGSALYMWVTRASTFLTTLKSRLSDDSLIIKASESETRTRDSLNGIKDKLNVVFASDGVLTEETADLLDSCFGTGTKAFLTMGSSVDFEDESINIKDSLAVESSKIETELCNIIFKTALEERLNYLSSQEDNILEKLKDIYKKYYTEASVNKQVTSLDYHSFTGLILNNGYYREGFSQGVHNILKEIYASSITPFSFSKWEVYYKLDMHSDDYSALEEKDQLNVSDAKIRFDILNQAEERVKELIQNEIDALFVENYKEYTRCSAGSVYDSSITYYINSLGALADTSSYIAGKTDVSALYTLTLKNYALPTTSQVMEYLNALNGEDLNENNVYYSLDTLDADNFAHISLTAILPIYDEVNNTFTPSVVVKKDADGQIIALDPSCFLKKKLIIKNEGAPDVSTTALFATANFIKTALEGTGSSNYYVKYVAGDDELSGRKNSLYYKRYQMLNNRMNTIKGSLSSLIQILRNKDIIEASRKYDESVQDSYKEFLSVTPISSMEELSWLPEQKATGTTIELPGKFYYAKEMEALRAAISGQCILTCTSCTIKDSCPFYDEEEIVKLYCTPAETLDLYFKDNELDLLSYDSTPYKNDKGETVYKHSINVKYTNPDNLSEEWVDTKALMNTHAYYNDILRKLDGSDKHALIADYENSEDLRHPISRDLQLVREEIRSDSSINKFNDSTDGENMGYLLGMRYGTVEKNNVAVLANEAKANGEFNEFEGRDIPEYQYLYNALLIKDEESYINYGVSPYEYNVTFEKGRRGEKKKYTGTVKLRVPTSLKALADANPEDDVYLVSDDTKDAVGNKIVPVIYLNQVKNLEWTFGIDLNPRHSCQSEDDKTIYASDVAQWCINYYKGNCACDPVGDTGADPSAPTKDFEADRDQYWMPEIKKYIPTLNNGTGGYITLEGRPREYTGYQEPVMSKDSFDEVMVAAGKPAIINGINFIRRFSIRIFDPSKAYYDENGEYHEEAAWKIKWVKNESADKFITVKTQKAVLPLMKTNLRLVVVKNRGN